MTGPEFPGDSPADVRHPAWCAGHENELKSCWGTASPLEAPGGWVSATPWLPRVRYPDGSVETGNPQVVVATYTGNPSLKLTTPEDAAAFAGLVDVLSPDHQLAAQVRSAAAQAWQ